MSLLWPEKLRRDALAILHAGVDAVDPERLVRAHLEGHPPVLPDGGRLFVVAIGKAAPAMATGALEALDLPVSAGVVVAPVGLTGGTPSGFEAYGAGHPEPDVVSVRGATSVQKLCNPMDERDGLVLLVSGGGSALMTLPPAGVPLESVAAVTTQMMRAGATIQDLNCVRKHLDQLKGGRLARQAAPGRVLALVLSDVVGNPLDVIASGPVSPDPTTFADALAVLEQLGVLEQMPKPAADHLRAGAAGGRPESPKPGDPCFRGVETCVVGDNRLAAEAAASHAESLGYETRLLTSEWRGEARVQGRELARQAVRASDDGPARCLLAAGETTVTVRGTGKGGRNQETALAASLELDGTDGVLIASMGTDGIDGPTDAAGAYADGRTRARGERLGLDAGQALANNDAYHFFEALGDLIITGPTGTNVMDLAVALTGSTE